VNAGVFRHPKRLALYGAVLVVAIVATVVAVFARAGGSAPSTTRARVATNSLVLIDDHDRVAAVVALGGEPTRLTYGGGAFWVAVPSKGFVARVDSRTHALRRFRVGEDPYDVAYGGGAVWVPDHDLGRVFRLDPQTGTTRKTASFHAPTVAAGYGLGAAWAIVVPGTLVRIDARSLTVTSTTADVSYAEEKLEPKLLFTDRDLVVESPAISSLARVDRRGRLRESRSVVGLTSATLAGTDLWVTDSTSVRRLGAATDVYTVVGTTPVDVAALAGSIWVAGFDRPVVERVSTSGKLRATIRLDRTPVAVAAGGRTVAVAVTSKVRRFQ
jgi:streptogramin lyase